MPYLLEDDKGRVDFETKVNEKLTPIQTAFQNNINAMYQKLVSLGSTPADKTPTAISNAIQAINDAIYNKLVSLGQTPASKTIANLNAKIQALTEITYSYTSNKNNSPLGDYQFYDCRMTKEIKLMAYTPASVIGGINVMCADANYNLIGEAQRLDTVGQTVNFLNGTKFVVFVTSNASNYSIRFTNQTKVLR